MRVVLAARRLGDDQSAAHHLCVLIVSWWSRPQEWFRILGLLSFLGAMTSLSLGSVGDDRDLAPAMGFASRYVTLAIPLLCCVYFVWELYAVRPLRHLGHMTLFALVFAMTGLSTVTSLGNAKAQRDLFRAMERDLRRGVPISDFVDCYVGRNFIFPPQASPRSRQVEGSWNFIVPTSGASDTFGLTCPFGRCLFRLCRVDSIKSLGTGSRTRNRSRSLPGLCIEKT